MIEILKIHQTWDKNKSLTFFRSPNSNVGLKISPLAFFKSPNSNAITRMHDSVRTYINHNKF